MRVVGFNQYQQLARRTVNSELSKRDQLMNFALGLCGEAGEVAELLTALDPRHADLASKLMHAAGAYAEHVKKTVFHRHPEWDQTKLKLREELGDLQWYLSQAADIVGATLEEIATENIEKLQKRYPHGFSCEASSNRPGEGT
ncbi:MAG: nucleoside triphosphate pyrophosphohydrolase family protein [Bacillota bacterium]